MASATCKTVSARALNAGVDMDMVSEGFVGTLKKSVHRRQSKHEDAGHSLPPHP